MLTNVYTYEYAPMQSVAASIAWQNIGLTWSCPPVFPTRPAKA